MIVLDEWQKEFIAYKGHKILVAGRQTGKSEAQAYDNALFAVNNPGTNVLLISKTERQSEELLIKTLNFLLDRFPGRVGRGKLKPLKHSVHVMPLNRKDKPSKIMCLPVGTAGVGIRAFTIHKLSVDEAQLVDDDVFTSITPMLLTTGGHISLTGTPRGRRGYFWNAYENKLDHFKVFHINSEEVINNRAINASWTEQQRKNALDHLAQEKQRMTPKQFAQEYEGLFVEDLDQLFPDELINISCNIFRQAYNGKNYLGVDVGRTTDPSTFEVITVIDDKMKQVESLSYKGLAIPQTKDKVLELNKAYKFRKMGIDGGGLGAGVVDLLMLERNVISKVYDLNNSSRTIAENGKKKLLKEQMYLNLYSLLATGKLKLLADEDIKMSLKSCMIEYVENSDDFRVFGNDTHHAEGIARAAWLAAQDKSLNLFATYSNSR
ncbi:MAG: hypothetical protein HC874_27290 [Richelia sp. SL_2_1]|nr:hypothetical protein [Richelia sp. SL_2_1]